jgi:ABC-type uncharacterized transport system ATPase subunit
VLAEGRVLAEGTPAAVRADPAVAEAYLGRREGISNTAGTSPAPRP